MYSFPHDVLKPSAQANVTLTLSYPPNLWITKQVFWTLWLTFTIMRQGFFFFFWTPPPPPPTWNMSTNGNETCTNSLKYYKVLFQCVFYNWHYTIYTETKVEMGQTYSKNEGNNIMKQKWRWARHIARMKDNGWTKCCTDWQPRRGKRSRGWPSRRWQDDIARKEETTWIRKATDRRQWKTLMEGYILQWMDKA